MIPFNPALPNIAKSEPIRVFRVGQYLALLLEKPKSLADTGNIGTGLITYAFALAVVTTTKPEDLALIITSEESGPELRRIVKEKTGLDQVTDPFLCIFDDKGGHHNLGHSPDWANQERFVQRALDIVRERFKIVDAAVEVPLGGNGRSPRPKSLMADWSAKQYLLLGIAAAVAAMIIFPPYRILGLQGVVHRTGYAFIFDLPNRASVDIGQLFVQWIALLVIGAIAYALLGKRS